jgi:hypothetical protein
LSGRKSERKNDRRLSANEISRQRRQTIVLIPRIAIFERDVLALDVAGFAQPLLNRG